MSFEYEVSYRAHCTLQLDSGRRIVLDSLFQWRTYAGLLEGVPFREMNDQLVEHATSRAETLHPDSGRPHVIPPIRCVEEQTFGPHTVEWLPHVTCVAHFHDIRPARDLIADSSSLVIVWFQSEFGQPSEGPIMQKLRAVDWDSLATDSRY